MNKKSNDAIGKYAKKLSSGLRINNASDDAAGLAISEKMRAQIIGLDQGSRNIQDGISLIQTGEGGLSEIHSLLQRGRELSVQAANGVLSLEDRDKIQEEINQIKDGVNEIATNTQFNNINLLSSSTVSGSNAQNIINGLKSEWLSKTMQKIKDSYGLDISGSGQTMKVVLDSGTPYGELAHVGGGTTTFLELHIDMSDFDPATGNDGDTVQSIAGNKGFYADRIIAHEMTHAAMDIELGAAKMNDFHSNNAIWFVEGTAELLPGNDERLKGVIGNSSNSAIDATKLSNLISRATDLLNGALWNGDDTDYAAGYIICKYLDKKLIANGKDFEDLMTAVKGSVQTGTNALKNAVGSLTTLASYSNFITDFQTNGSALVNGLALNFGGDEVDTGSLLGSDQESGTSFNAESVINEAGGVTPSDQPVAGLTITWPDLNECKPLKIQLGANEGETIDISLSSVTSVSLGIDDANVVSAPGESITKFDNAIGSVSKYRSYFGAMQNRLEHAKGIVDISSENTVSSESRIRDLDMAKEMMGYSKENVLQQSAQTMLAQANSAPNIILQLLNQI
jgi:Flagellin and related hook-associated proteins